MSHSRLGQALLFQRRGVSNVDQAGRIPAAGRIALYTAAKGIHGDVLTDNLSRTLPGAVEVVIGITDHLAEQYVRIRFSTKQLTNVVAPGFPASLGIQRQSCLQIP